MKTVRRYAFGILMLLVAGLLGIVLPQSRPAIARNMALNMREMVSVIPAIFILMGLADVYVSREMVIKYMGQKSALVGVFLAILLGALAAGPLYAAFPIASMMLRKGASFMNVMVFLGAWSTLKVPMFLFETTSLGATFSVTRIAASTVAVMTIAAILNTTVSHTEKAEVIRHQEELESNSSRASLQ